MTHRPPAGVVAVPHLPVAVAVAAAVVLPLPEAVAVPHPLQAVAADPPQGALSLIPPLTVGILALQPAAAMPRQALQATPVATAAPAEPALAVSGARMTPAPALAVSMLGVAEVGLPPFSPLLSLGPMRSSRRRCSRRFSPAWRALSRGFTLPWPLSLLLPPPPFPRPRSQPCTLHRSPCFPPRSLWLPHLWPCPTRWPLSRPSPPQLRFSQPSRLLSWA